MIEQSIYDKNKMEDLFDIGVGNICASDYGKALKRNIESEAETPYLPTSNSFAWTEGKQMAAEAPTEEQLACLDRREEQLACQDRRRNVESEKSNVISGLYLKPNIDIRSIDISRINSEIEIAIQSKSLMLSDKLKISLVLIERMTMNTVKLIKSKIESIGVLNDVVLKLLNEAREVSLNEPKRMFLGLSISSNSLMLSYMLRKTIDNYLSSLSLFIENTLNCATIDYVKILIEAGYESLVFNVMRKSILSEIREYIYENINNIKDGGIKMLIKKEYLKTKQAI